MTELLASKRIRIALAALVLWAAARFGFDLDPGAVDRVIDLAMVVIASFGLSGFGKDRSAQELEAAKGGVVVARMEMTTVPPPIVALPPLPPPPFAAQAPSLAPRPMDLSKISAELRDEAHRSRTIKPKP